MIQPASLFTHILIILVFRVLFDIVSVFFPSFDPRFVVSELYPSGLLTLTTVEDDSSLNNKYMSLRPLGHHGRISSPQIKVEIWPGFSSTVFFRHEDQLDGDAFKGS